MRRAFESIVIIALLLANAGGARATFHDMSISELGAGFQGNAAIQFVELRLDSAGQNRVDDTRLTVFAADGTATQLLLTDGDVTNAARGANILYATEAFAAATGVTPDFVMPASLLTPSGMICWGAPGIVPRPPGSWDLTKPENYVDCVAYGGFPGATRPGSGTPTALGPGDGTQSLTRTKGTGVSGSNDTDFALATPTVCNNAGACTDLAPGDDVCGDADGDGSITVADGVQALRAAAELSSTCTPARCDVDGDGAFGVSDGVQVLRAAAELPTVGDCTAAE
jgi:hypothetical protein